MPDKRANIIVFKKNKLLTQKKILFVLVVILLAIPITVALALTQQNFFKFADAGAVIETIEVSPGVVSIDVNSPEPVYLSTLAYDSFGDPVYYLDVNYEWSMSSTDTVGSLSKTSGEITEFKPLEFGCGEITITASWGQEVVTKAVQVSVSDGKNIPNCTGIPTPTATPTPEPNPTVLNFESIKLHGLGKGGDNTNENTAGNENPLRTSREISIEFEDSTGNKLEPINGLISYASSAGVFTGSVNLPPEIKAGDYILKVKSPQFLKRQVKGIVTIIENITINLPELSLITGDVNDDNAIDLADYNLIIDCYSDLLPPKNCSDENKKNASDLSDDGFVNADDYTLFIRELSVLSGD